jgi:nitroimidazol reductase NimA-like FMN-containing flavoprotein (pyridoxamine 5'-phosphate oxidase superfamily)
MSAGSAYAPTARTVPTRYRERARYDRATVHGVLDEALICHVGFVGADGPVVLPTTHARLGETLYLHGSTGSGPMLAAGSSDGLPVCGTARLVQDRDEKLRAFAALLDHVAPGRSIDSRSPNARELAATAVLALDLVEVSAKVRTGGPVDDPEDTELPYWAGVVPITLQAGTPIPVDDLDPAIQLPAYLAPYRRG